MISSSAGVWSVTFSGFDPRDEGRREALCTLGNGYQAVRGSFASSHADGIHYPGVYAAGFFNRLHDRMGGQDIENESMVNLPNWLTLRVGPSEAPPVSLNPTEVLEHRVTLDMRRGLLTRLLRVTDAQDRRTTVRERRFVHMGRRHLAGTQTVIIPENWSGRLTVYSGLDGAVTNSGVARYRDLAGRHLHVDTLDEPDPDTLLLVARTTQSQLLVAVAARSRFTDTGSGPAPTRTLTRGEHSIGHAVALDVVEARPVTVEKIAALVTSRDVAISHPGPAALEQLADAGDFDTLLTGHELAWDHLWRRFDTELVTGDTPAAVSTQRTLHLGLFHILQTLSPHNRDLDAGVPARGLHGEAYRGHLFWDELFILPVLTLRMPQLTRALLNYRVRRLDAARRAAHREGRRGAMYPWQSGSDGREESQRIHLNPLSGRWLPDTSHLQRHVGLAVAYNIWHYVQATNDLDFLSGHGAEVLLEVARYFADLAEHDPAMDRYRIRGVMGPDEYSTRYPAATEPGVDDNAYTNVMAVWLWHRARDTLALLPTRRRVELVERLGLTPAELLRWQTLTRRTYVPFRTDGVLDQFHEASLRAELDWDDYRRRYGDLQRLDRILEAEGRAVDDYQVSKQADVLMLFYLLSADELRELLDRLGYPLPADAIPRTITYHLARTVHGSTLSALVHAWVLARAHRADALHHFERALRSDLADMQGGSTAEGVHLGAMAGAVDLLQRCFAGLEARADALWFNPCWPQRFGALQFVVEYRGVHLDVRVTGRDVRIAAAPGPGQPVRIGCGEHVRTLAPGETAHFTA